MLLLDGQLDVHLTSLLEQKFEKSRFVRVDSDVVTNLIKKEDEADINLTDKQKEELKEVFSSLLPATEKTTFEVDFKALGEFAKPVQITQNEFTRRMKEMSAMQTGFAFYGEMPDSYNVVLNTDNHLIKKVIADVDGKETESIKQYANENATVRQLVDLALLANNMLKGEALSNFINRSIGMID